MSWRLGDAIGLREGEGARTARLFALILSLMSAVVFAKAAQRGLFLAAFPRSAIPNAFVASALCLAAASFLVSAVAARLGPTRLLLGALIVSAVALVGARIAITSTSRAAPFSLYVLVEVISGVIVVQGWTTVTTALDVRSSKRLLPLVGNAAGVAWTIGGFATGAIVRWLGTPALLLLAAGLMLAGAAVVRSIERNDFGGRPARGARSTPLWAGARDGLRYVFGEPLLRALAVLTVLALLVEQLLDYLLFAAAQHHYATHPDQIAAFMGTFFGVTGAIALVAPLAFSGRILSRFGSAWATVAESATVLIGSLTFLLVPGFAVIVAVRGVHRVAKQTLSSPARAQMQTTIPPVRRAQAGALLKGVLAPLFYAAGGGALKLLPPTAELHWLSLATAAMAAAAIVIVLSRLRGAYLIALRRAADRRSLTLDRVVATRCLLDREQSAALIADLAGSDVGRAAFAASLLATAEPAVARDPLRAACAHEHPAVREGAVDALVQLGRSSDSDAIAQLLARSELPEEQRTCIRALAALEPRALAEALRHRDDSGALGIRYRTLATACDGLTGDDQAVAELAAMLCSPDDELRGAAAWAMGEIRLWEPPLREPFFALLGDADTAVRATAVRSAGRIGDHGFTEPLVQALARPEIAISAMAAVGELPDDAAPEIEAAIIAASTGTLCRLATAMAASTGAKGDALLATLLMNDHRVVRYRAARALAARRRVPGWHGPQVEQVHTAIRKELLTGYGYYALLVGVARTDGVDDFEIEPEFEFVAAEIRLRIRQTERRMFALLALLIDADTIGSVRVQLQRRDEVHRARGIELLEHSLAPRVARSVVPFFEPLPLRLRLARLREDLPVPTDYQTDPLPGIMELTDPHLHRCAIYTYRERAQREYPDTYSRHCDMLPLVERIYFLRRIPMFQALSAEDVTQVALIAEQVDYTSSETIFHKDDPGDVLYLVVRGQVAIRDGRRDIATFGAHEFFGELAVLDDEPRSADAICTNDSELLRIAGADLEELMHRRPAIAREIIRVLARRLRAANERPLAAPR